MIHVTGDRIGDALIKWPVIVALKKALPEHRLIWIAGLRKSVFKGPLAVLARGVIDEITDLANVGVQWRELLRPPPVGRFDIVIATEPKVRNAVLLRRVEHRVFISPAANFRFSDRKPARGIGYPGSVYEQMRCLAVLAAGRELKIDAKIEVGEENDRRARELLPDGQEYIGLAPGSAGATKRWPLRCYIELAKYQIRCGLVPVFFLGPEELTMYGEIAPAVPTARFPEQEGPRGGPLFSIALAKRLTLGVANDAGGGHLLAAGGRPLITLFGHTSEYKFKPPYGRRIAVTARDYGGIEMERIPIARVNEEIAKVVYTNHQ